ncbi:MAG: RNB domain-containing ribonuclease, partial [Pseudomonadota bacterium]
PERLDGLRQYLGPLGYSLPKADEIRAFDLNRVIARARERDELDIIALAVLRAQSQAIYDTDNIGHFGLSLKRYAHFTSPIRRYADLTVHRGLVRALGLGPGGERDEDQVRLTSIAGDISVRERTAISAERDTESRLLASHLEDKIGTSFSGRISGVTRTGLFVALDETGADGFVPARTLGWEYFAHDEAKRALIGEKTGAAYTLGMPVRVRLLEAAPVQGGLRFELLTKPQKPKGSSTQEKKDQQGAGKSAKGRPRKTKAKGQRKREPEAQADGQQKAPKSLTRRPRKRKQTGTTTKTKKSR